MHGTALLIALLNGVIWTNAICSASSVITADFAFECTSFKQSKVTAEKKAATRMVSGRVQMLESRKAWQIQFRRVANASLLYAYTNGTVCTYTTILESDASTWGRYGGSPIVAPASADGGPIGMEIEPGSMPLAGYWEANLTWFVWCSGEYLSTTNCLLPDLVTKVREDRFAFGFRDFTKRNRDWLGAPSEMIQYYDHELILRSPSHPLMPRASLAKEHFEVRNPSLWVKSGQKRTEFRVLSTQNILGANWPTEFQCTSFHPTTDGSTDVMVMVHGSISALSTNEPMQFPTDIINHTSFSVVDHRFRHPSRAVDYLHYAQTNFAVQSMDSPAVSTLYTKAIQEAPLDYHHLRRLRFQYVVMILAGSIGITLVWFLIRTATARRMKPPILSGVKPPYY